MLALLAGVNANASTATQYNCIICEHIALAASEADALSALSATTDDTSHYCINGGGGSGGGPPASYDFDATSQYCVAQYFVYYAKDMAQ